MRLPSEQITRRDFILKNAAAASGFFAGMSVISPMGTRSTDAAEDPGMKSTNPKSVVMTYTVNPEWPQKPAAINWDKVPGVFVDIHDRVWIITRSLPAVQVYDTDGKFLMAWGKKKVEVDSSLSPANRTVDISFTSPNPVTHYLKIDHEGNVWFTECDRHVVRKCTPDGKLLLTLGTLNESGDDEAHFNRPTDMAVTRNGVFVSDGYGNRRIVQFDPNGRFIRTWGREGTRPGEFRDPHSIVADSQGRLYVADRGNARIQIFSPDGTLLDLWSDIIVPWGLWMSDVDELWVCGSSPMRTALPPKDQLIMKFTPDRKLLQHWSLPKGVDGQEKSGEVNWVHGVALDSTGNIYLSDIRGKRIQQFKPV